MEVTAIAPNTLRVFASKPFMRFARRFEVEDEALWETVNGAYDADLGGGVFKYRLAREEEGSSGGASFDCDEDRATGSLDVRFRKEGPGKHQTR